MRKLFTMGLLAVMAIMIICSTGCRIGGFDDGTGATVPPPAVTQDKNIVIPIDVPESAIDSATLASSGMTLVPNIVGAENAANLSCLIKGQTYKPNTYKKYTDKNSVKRIIFLVVVNYVTIGNPTGNLPVQILSGSTPLADITIANVEQQVITTTYTTSTAPTSLQVAQVVMTSLFGGTNTSGLTISSTVNIVGAVFTTTTSGTLSVTNTTGSTFVIQTVTITQVIPIVVPDPTPYVPPVTTLAVSSVSMLNTDANAVSTSTLLFKNALGTTLANLTPVFIIKFNKSITAIPTAFSVKATRMDNGTVVNFDQTTQDLTVSKYSDTELQVAITSAVRTLRPNSTYKVEFVSGTIDGTAITFTDYYTFKTAPAGLMSYAAYAGTTLTNSVQGGVTYVTPTVDKIQLNFNYPLASNITSKLASVLFRLTGPSNSAAMVYGNVLGTPTQTNSKTILIPLLKKMSTGLHTISYFSGDLRDIDGNALDTSLVVSFIVR
ncbi:MAG: hypothetical protein HQM09_18145 [Candidatus Riflebacteria bacterium]|nr:hypothetical protein [Candidatus Riflebacteria bacterium]